MQNIILGISAFKQVPLLKISVLSWRFVPPRISSQVALHIPVSFIQFCFMDQHFFQIIVSSSFTFLVLLIQLSFHHMSPLASRNIQGHF